MSNAFGEQTPTLGEDAVSWQTWSDGAGAIPNVTINPDWGKLSLQTAGAEGRSAVYDLGSAATRKFTLTENRYGTGSGSATLQIRGDTSSFVQDDAVPAWETYSAPISRGWRYVQVRETTYSYLLLSVSGDGRYILDRNSNPFLLIGDSPQGMMSDLTPAQMETYMANRESYGINAIQVHLLAGATFGGNSTTFQAQDGTHPFTIDGDISTPNESYFVQVDAMLNLAASHGMVVVLTAAEYMDCENLLVANGVTKCTNFGAYLGARYKSYSNIIWNFGNDFNGWPDAGVNAIFLAVADGILSEDTNHMMTSWMDIDLGDRFSASRDSDDWDSRINIDLGYSYKPTYDIILDEYALSPVKPVYLGESNYEGESWEGYESTPLIIRKQMWWAMLSGACGHFYCNEDIYAFLSGWVTRLDSYPGLTHVTYLTVLLSSYDWWLMIPDTTSMIITAGRGTYSNAGDAPINTNDYATCAYIAGVSLAMIYMPANRTMTVDMSQFSNTVTCRWFDPTDGSYAADAASPHANSGTHDFSRAGANASGDHDWILVLSV